MSEMQKVRVSLTDADGKVHEVVGYRDKNGGGWIQDREELDLSGRYWYIEFKGVEVTPVRELPTGLGAVVEVTYTGIDTERFIRVHEDYWYATGPHTSVDDTFLSKTEFTILSEGIK